MKIVSWNVNGLRSVTRRGFIEWLVGSGIDVLCLQEIKISSDDITSQLKNITGYHSYFSHAAKKGYAGVGIYARTKPVKVTENVFGSEIFKQEGRTLLVEFDQVAILNVYMPHGGRDRSKLDHKLKAYEALQKFISDYHSKPLVIAGDFNIAHDDIDLARPKQNRKNIMFTEDEREQLDRVINLDFADSYRNLHPDTTAYSWWPYMARARERYIGWRIDYIFVQNKLISALQDATIQKEVLGSDHCPVAISLTV
jgi:exodeoxyribonuclease-3